MQLYIGNKNYSSWSMRAWVLMRGLGIPFEEVQLRYDSFAPGSNFKQQATRVSPTGRVPVLVDGDLAVWDTLAITEYLAEQFPQHGVWPSDTKARARARSLCAEMHAGFTDLRHHCSMNLEASLPEVGERLWSAHEGLRADVSRLVGMWTDALSRSGGPFLFGDFCAADAYFAPVAGRQRTYALPVPPDIEAYLGRLLSHPGVAAWVHEALQERDFVAFAEAYRKARD